MNRTNRKIWDLFELRYPHRLTPFRSWKRYLSILTATLAVTWVGMAAVLQDQSLHTSGPMSLGHTMLANQCSACHDSPWQGIAGLVDNNRRQQDMNKACLSCHENSIGHNAMAGDNSSRQWSAWHEPQDSLAIPTSMDSIACTSCHVEHEGPSRLVVMSDAQCVRCHADLSERVSHGQFTSKITNFAIDHPEFDVIADKLPDGGTIKLNHKIHMAENLRGLLPGRKQMSCDDCHRAGLGSYEWPYARLEIHDAIDMRNAPREPQLQAAYMNQIRYSKHCANCHAMESTSLSSIVGRDVTLPHAQPETVHTVLQGELTTYIEDNLDELMKDESRPRSRRPTAQPMQNKQMTNQLVLDWVGKKRGLVEQELYIDKKGCVLCHALEPSANVEGIESLPVVTKSNIPMRWLMQASFSHEKHRVLDCLACHTQAMDNTNHTEVMMPSIDICLKCHGDRVTDKDLGGVSYGCVLCHTYHMPPERPLASGLKLKSLLSGQ